MSEAALPRATMLRKKKLAEPLVNNEKDGGNHVINITRLLAAAS
jgi:hypothetical protein